MLVSGMAKGAFFLPSLFSSAHLFLSRLLIARSYTKFRQGNVAYERNCFFERDECINNDSPSLLPAYPGLTADDLAGFERRCKPEPVEPCGNSTFGCCPDEVTAKKTFCTLVSVFFSLLRNLLCFPPSSRRGEPSRQVIPYFPPSIPFHLRKKAQKQPPVFSSLQKSHFKGPFPRCSSTPLSAPSRRDARRSRRAKMLASDAAGTGPRRRRGTTSRDARPRCAKKPCECTACIRFTRVRFW